MDGFAGLDTARAMDVARRAVAAGGAAALAAFRAGITPRFKSDRSPVTEADEAAERAILAVVRAAFPEHAILAEESGASGPPGAPRWIVDPLDGTRGFARGGSFWGPLVALEAGGTIVAGALALPALGLAYWGARGQGSWRCEGDAAPAPVRLGAVTRWEDATLSLGEPRLLLGSPFGPGVVALATSAASTRCYGDVAGFALLLDGRAEAWVECGVQPWDLGPYPVLVEEAGGRLTGLDGGAQAVHRGHALATNGALHDHALAVLARGG